MNFSQLYGQLPAAFQPHDFAERGARTKWRAAIHQILFTLPPSALPSGLELRTSGNHYQPPRFDFGWKLSTQELTTYAQSHGFLATTSSPSTLDTVRMTNLLNQVLARAQVAVYVRIDVLSTPPAGQHHRRSSSSSTAASIASTATATSPSAPPSRAYCITVADNHRSGNRIPDAGVMAQLQSLLQLPLSGEKPRWHLDHQWNTWQWKSSEEILAGERQYMKSFLENK